MGFFLPSKPEGQCQEMSSACDFKKTTVIVGVLLSGVPANSYFLWAFPPDPTAEERRQRSPNISQSHSASPDLPQPRRGKRFLGLVCFGSGSSHFKNFSKCVLGNYWVLSTAPELWPHQLGALVRNGQDNSSVLKELAGWGETDAYFLLESSAEHNIFWGRYEWEGH